MSDHFVWDKGEYEGCQGMGYRIEELEQEILKFRQREEEYKKNKIELDAIFNKLPLIMFAVDKDLRLLNLNAAAVAMTRRAKKKSIGMYGGDALHCLNSLNEPQGCGFSDACKSCVIRNSVFDSFQTGADHQSIETTFPYCPENKCISLQVIVSTIVLNLPNKRAVIVCIEDITRRKLAEKAFKESEQRFRILAEFSCDWAYWIRPDDNYAYISPSCSRITGYEPDEFKNNPDLMMKIIHPNDREIFGRHKHACNESGGIPIINFRIINKQGDERWIQHTCQAIYDSDGVFLGRRGSNRDITEYKQLQEEVLKARKLESLGTLSAGIAHDFNNLLAVVVGNISMALEDVEPGSAIFNNLKAAEKACLRSKALTARLITFSKGGEPVKNMISIGSLLKNTVLSALKNSDIKPEFFISDFAGQVNIDECQIKEVIHNIVINAKEAMNNHGQLIISCENIHIAEQNHLPLNQGEYIKISFKDQGCGISKENLNNIFDPYFSTKEMGPARGQGLGLTISYSIIQKHGGLIGVESWPGKGSTFSIYLPVFLSNKTLPKKLKEKHPAQKPLKKSDTSDKGKILLMDDEEAIRNFMDLLLTKSGYNIETCVEGRETVEVYKKAMESKDPFDVVILDLTNQYGIGGVETMKRLLEIDPDTKGIIITGYSDDPVVNNFRAYGFSGFIAKPSTRDQMLKTINNVLSKKK